MKYKLILGIITLACFFSNAVFGQTDSPTAAPKMVIAQTEFNFGEVKKGVEVSHSFTVKNEGNADLLIFDVVPSCGCTASNFTKVVPAGKEGQISLSIKTADFSGAINKYADVRTNDPQRPKFTLSMNMVVGNPGPATGRQVGQFIIGPSDRWSASIPRGTAAETGITIYNNGSQPVRITKVIPGGEKFTVSLDTLEEGKRYVVRVKSDPQLAIGSHKQVVKLITEGGEAAQPSEIALQLEAAIYSPVTANPKEINFGTLTISEPDYNLSSVAKFTWVRQFRNSGFEIKKVSSTLPFLVVTVEPENEGHSYRLKIGFDKEKLTPGTYKGVVKVETNNPDVPVVEIGVSLIAK